MNVKEEHMIFLFNPHSNMYVCMYVCISNSDFKSDTKTYRTGNYIKEVGKIRALDPRSGATSRKLVPTSTGICLNQGVSLPPV